MCFEEFGYPNIFDKRAISDGIPIFQDEFLEPGVEGIRVDIGEGLFRSITNIFR